MKFSVHGSAALHERALGHLPDLPETIVRSRWSSHADACHCHRPAVCHHGRCFVSLFLQPPAATTTKPRALCSLPAELRLWGYETQLNSLQPSAAQRRARHGFLATVNILTPLLQAVLVVPATPDCSALGWRALAALAFTILGASNVDLGAPPRRPV